MLATSLESKKSFINVDKNTRGPHLKSALSMEKWRGKEITLNFSTREWIEVGLEIA